MRDGSYDQGNDPFFEDDPKYKIRESEYDALVAEHDEARELLRQVVEHDWHEGWSKRAHELLRAERGKT